MSKYRFNSDQYGIHSKILAEIGSNQKILEVGCASGYISKKLQKKGNIVTAVEIDPSEAKKALRYCQKVYVGDIESKIIFRKIKKLRFNRILLADVLEHFKNPEDTLLNLSNLLDKRGKIIISVPNIAFLTNRLSHLLGRFEYTDWGIMDKTHLRFFTKQTALDLIKKGGLKVVKFDYTGGFTQLPLFMKVIHPLIGEFNWFKKLEYHISGLWPEGLAFQFLFVCQKTA
ncbi:class I SAM-dependent methyltransferase [Candidatus Daviesbacteria bacterium]|nr:class I SAM-dependent methyltransferase [Candidatus Daviesbacteria bacterium]